MKKYYLSLIILMLVLKSSSQEFTLSFKPSSNIYIIDSVIVTNITTCQIVKLIGNETLDVKNSTLSSEIQIWDNTENVIPNPNTGNATLRFETNSEQSVVISIYNNSGQLIKVQKINLNSGLHKFNIILPKTGLYFISVYKDGKNSNFKVICHQQEFTNCRIDYIGNENSNQKKSATINKNISCSANDILHHSVFSGVNNTIIADSPKESKEYTVEFYECVDNDNDSYPIVKIGNQWWMAKNLAYLPFVSPPIEGSETYPHYYVNGYEGSDVYFAKSFQNYAIYGVLYNWPAVMGGEISSIANPSGVRGICPSGWHVPSDAEWEQLAQYINNQKGPYIQDVYGENSHWHDVGGHLKSQMGWHNNNYNTDDFGFTGLPGGMRSEGGAMSEGPGIFLSPGPFGVWWSSTALDYAPYAYYRDLNSFDNTFTKSYDGKIRAFSVRCVKDN